MEAQVPELFQSCFCPQFNSDNNNPTNNGGGDHFMVEDLFDFSNDNGIITEGSTFDSITVGNSNDNECSPVTAVDSSCNSSSFSGCEPNFVADIGCRNFPDVRFSGDIGVPYDDFAHLEWLSNFVEESFSSEDLQKLQLISGIKARTEEASETRGFQPEPSQNNPVFNPELSVPAKARSKRSRAPPCSWASRLLVLTPSESEVVVSTPLQNVNPEKKPGKPTIQRKQENGDGSSGDGRKCLHCATDKTPQWRTGPMGPKTLCNACGVRYKSGRLVPEYRPAASPTYMLTKHSNSHRKVLELRRQKEMMRAQQMQQHQFLHHQGMMFDASNGEDYLIHQHVGPNYRQLI